MAYARYVAGWDVRAAQIAGIALCTTSVAVVYAVMVETGLNRTEIGKLILAACFVTDLGTVLALGVLFARSDWRLLVFASATAISLAVATHIFPKAFRYFQAHIAELEGKVVAATLFTLGGLALAAGSEAVLPAYLLGLTLATTLSDRADVLHKLRSTAFLLLTPFYFMKAGLYVSLPALGASLATVAVFLSLFGLQHGIIDQSQYTVLVTVVILSAVVPTLIAQAFFRPGTPGPRPALRAAASATPSARH